MVRLEHGVQVADQQDALAPAVAGMGGDQMAGAAGMRHRLPLDPEAQGLEFGSQQACHGLDAGGVEGAAVLLDQAPQQIDGVIAAGIDGGQHPLLGRRRRGQGRAGEGQQQGEDGAEGSGHRDRLARGGPHIRTGNGITRP